MSIPTATTGFDSQCLILSRRQQGATHGQRMARLFREHYGSLVRFLQGRLHSHEEAREVAQDAYVQLLGLDRPEGIHCLQRYLYSTAANLATNRIKQRLQRRRNDGRMFFETEDARSPERLCLAGTEAALVVQALSELPANCRDAFHLVKLNGLSSEEAGRQLNMHPRRVRRYVARALAHCLAVVEIPDRRSRAR